MTAKSTKVSTPEAQQAAALETNEHYLPPRSTVHGKAKERHIFYRSLLWIFILLVTGLLAWGWNIVKA